MPTKYSWQIMSVVAHRILNNFDTFSKSNSLFDWNVYISR